MKRVRLYVQVGPSGQRAYFKEPGDPRAIRRSDGKIVSQEQEGPGDDLARELLFNGRYNPAGPYPLPRWIGSVGAMAGAFASEQRNLSWFENPIPLLLLLVAGGSLKKETHEFLKQKLSEAKSPDMFPAISIIEAIKAGGGGIPSLGEAAGFGANTTPKIDVVKLNDVSPSDGQFQVFDQNSRAKVRSACGVPALFTAETQDYTRATAQAALQVAEQGTFAPSRRRLDTIINRHVMPRIEAKWFVYRGNGPSLTSMEDVLAASEALTKLGAGSPNVGVELVGKALGVDLPKFEQSWGDLPFPLVQALANQGLLDVMQEDRLERAVKRCVEAVLVEAEKGFGDGGCGCG